MNVLYNISKFDAPFPKNGKIVSLVPSQTELLFDLGLSNNIVGVTKFCIHPFAARKKTAIGGTKKVDADLIISLKPDLIIGNKEENEREFMQNLAQRCCVFMSDIFTLDDSLEMIRRVGVLTDTSAKAQQIIDKIDAEFDKIDQNRPDFGLKTCLYLIWRKPYMAAASDTFIDDMLRRAGFKNAVADLSRYPELTIEQIAARKPDTIFLSSEPFPFKEKHIYELQRACPNAKIQIVDGELFSWYGSRLQHAPVYFNGLFF